MADESDISTEIKETDIVFECPYCQKSLAIDYRAAGLVISCTDCGQIVEVPIPEGMDISDLDVPEADQLARAMQYREALANARAKVLQLEEKIKRLTEQRHGHDLDRTELTHGLNVISREAEIIGKAVEQILSSLTKLTHALNKDA